MELSKVFDLSINELLSGERLDEERYRKKAEENITQLMKRRNPGKVLLHLALSVLFVLVAFASMVLVAGKVVDRALIPVMFFWNTLLLTANLAAGVIYGGLKRWKKWTLLVMVVADGALLTVMIYLLYIIFIVFQML